MGEQWGPTAVSALAVAVIAALGTWALRLYSKRLDTMLAMRKLDAGLEKGANSRTVTELKAALDRQGRDIEQFRKECHEARDLAHGEALKRAANEARLQACEEDRAELWNYVAQMSSMLKSQGLPVPLIPPRPANNGGVP